MSGNRSRWQIRPLVTRRRVIVLAVVAVALVIVGLSLPSPSRDAHDSAEAVNQCQMAIANRLSTPPDATFSSTSILTPSGWDVTGSVAFANTSEIETSTTFQCTVWERSRTDDTTIDWIR